MVLLLLLLPLSVGKERHSVVAQRLHRQSGICSRAGAHPPHPSIRKPEDQNQGKCRLRLDGCCYYRYYRRLAGVECRCSSRKERPAGLHLVGRGRSVSYIILPQWSVDRAFMGMECGGPEWAGTKRSGIGPSCDWLRYRSRGWAE